MKTLNDNELFAIVDFAATLMSKGHRGEAIRIMETIPVEQREYVADSISNAIKASKIEPQALLALQQCKSTAN